MFDTDNAEDTPRRIAIYIRVSTAEQKIEGYSFDAQKKRLREYIENNPALKLITKPEWLYSDVHTGSDFNREGLQNLLRDVKEKKYDGVIVWKIDRLSRSLKHLLNIFETLEDEGVSFISVQENIDFRGPIGKLIFQIFGAIAQFERELIKGRTTMGKIASAEAGNFTGTNIPYGYRPKVNKGGKGKKLELIDEEKQVVQRIYNWCIFDNYGDEKIAKLLNGADNNPKIRKPSWEKDDDGKWMASYPNTKWTHKMVKYILTEDLYRSVYYANIKDESGNELPIEKWTTVHIPPCVSEFTFRQAQNARKNRDGGSADSDYLLSGKLRDMSLEKPKAFVGARRYKGGFSYRRKQFDTKDGLRVPVFEIPGQQLEDFVWGKVMDAMKDPEAFVKHYLSREYADPTKIKRIEANLDGLKAHRALLDLKIIRIEEAFETGAYSEEKMSRKISEINEEVGRVDTSIQEAEDALTLMSSVDIEVSKLKEASEIVKYRLEKLNRKEKKVICNLFVDRVEMNRVPVQGPGKKRWRSFAEVYFRFNPEEFKVSSKGVEPKNRVQKPANRISGDNNVQFGGRGGI